MTSETTPRLIVLGGWQRQSSYLIIDERGARFRVLREGEHEECPGSAALAVSLVIDPLGPNAMKFDHHLHTARHSPDSVIDPLEMIRHALAIGLDGLVITEHDYQWEPEELAELAGRATPLRVFSGAEISAEKAISWSTASLRWPRSRRASSSPS